MERLKEYLVTGTYALALVAGLAITFTVSPFLGIPMILALGAILAWKGDETPKHSKA